MLKDFIDELRDHLNRYKDEHDEDDKVDQEINDIISDYEQLYTDALSSGLTDEEVVKKLGTPTAIVKELGMFVETDDHSWKGKVVAISPFISVIAFFVFGLAFDLWHPGWLVFLLIPVVAIAVNTVGWFAKIMALSPFAAVITFFALIGLGFAEFAWLVFLLIPMIGMLHQEPVWRAIVFEITMILAIAGYVIVGPVMGYYDYAGYPFLLLLVYFMTDHRFYSNLVQLFTSAVGITVLLSVAAYIAIGFFLEGWYYGWLVFLTIPMVAIIRHSSRRHRLVALMPFICTIAFFAIGFLLDGWAYAWLAYLLIPMTAILTRK